MRSVRRRVGWVIGVFLIAGCSQEGTGPEVETDPTLAERALAAGLAPLPAEPIRPVSNPYVPARVELGHLLFFDPILSGPRDVACSTCHLPSRAFTDGRQFPSGAGGEGIGPERTDPGPAPLRLMPRNSPTVFNTGLYGRFGTEPTVNGTMFWSGSAFGIEDQVLNPIAADTELRGLTFAKEVAVDSVVARLRGIAEYVDAFRAAFPEVVDASGSDAESVVTPTTLRLALAAYLRELVTPNAPIDRYLRGEAEALSARAEAGLELFIGSAGCVDCHTGPLLSDFTMHVIGGGQAGLGRDTTPGDDLGWGEHGGTAYAFRTPPLRFVAESAPYLHAGTEATLRDLMRFKNAGTSAHDRVSDARLDARVRPLGLSEAQIEEVIAFLHALSDDVTVQGPLFQAPSRVPSGLEVPR